MNQQTKSGWIASFMIVGAVLVLGLLAGVYYVKSRQIQEASSQPVATENEPSKTEEQKPQASENKDKKQSQPQPSSDSNKDTKPTDKRTPATQPSDNKAPSKPTTSDDQAESSASDELPTTGPADLGARFIALGALAVAGAAYIQSRRGL